MKKIDLKKQYQQLYKASAKSAAIVDVPRLNYLMVDGQGDPNDALFSEAVAALYGVSYTLKFTFKKGKEAIDYPVMALEGLWWMEGIKGFDATARDKWKWTLMILQPEIVTEDIFQQAREEVIKKKGLPILSKLRLENFYEGLAAQIMHLGPYATEGPTIEKLHGFVKEMGYQLTGKHHEIYLGDPRKSAPEKLKTILRHPVKLG